MKITCLTEKLVLISQLKKFIFYTPTLSTFSWNLFI